jgi:hypothetical protein
MNIPFKTALTMATIIYTGGQNQIKLKLKKYLLERKG